MKQKRNDLILLGILLLIGIIWLILWNMIPQKNGAMVVVTVSGENVAEYPLAEDATYNILTDYGDNLLVIKDQQAKVIEADCPDKLCVKQHSISKNGESIVCLPHKVVVEVINGQEAEIDAYTD